MLLDNLEKARHKKAMHSYPFSKCIGNINLMFKLMVIILNSIRSQHISQKVVLSSFPIGGFQFLFEMAQQHAE